MPPRHSFRSSSLSGQIIAYRHLAQGCRAAFAMSLLCSRRRRSTMTMVVGVAWVSLLFIIRQQLKPPHSAQWHPNYYCSNIT